MLDIFKCIYIYIYICLLFLFLAVPHSLWGFPGGASGRELTCIAGDIMKHRFNPWIRKIPWRRAWQPTLSVLAWRIPRTEESGRLQFIGSQRLGHN